MWDGKESHKRGLALDYDTQDEHRGELEHDRDQTGLREAA